MTYTEILNDQRQQRKNTLDAINAVAKPISAQAEAGNPLLAAILQSLKAVEQTLTNKNIVSFLIPSGAAASLAAGATSSVCSIEIPEGFTGELEKFGCNISPLASFADVTFSLRSSGDQQPRFSSNAMARDSIVYPYDFRLSVEPGRTLALFAKNNGLNIVTVEGILIGYLRPVR